MLGRPKMKIIIFLGFALALSCSNGPQATVSSANETSIDSSSDPNDEPEDEIIAIPPTVIKGSYLACHVLEIKDKSAQISCSIVSDSQVVENLEIRSSDLIVKHGINTVYITDFSNNISNFSFKVLTSVLDALSVGLISIAGIALDPGAQARLRTVLSNETSPAPIDQNIVVPESSEPDPSIGQDENAQNATELNCSTLGGAWVRVPADGIYVEQDFCVMKYEAKCSDPDGVGCTANMANETAQSTADFKPWIDINQNQAISACTALGTGFKLISNPEYMAIATNIAGNSNNWESGIIGDGMLIRGHSDNNPGEACEAASSDTEAYVDLTCSGTNLGDNLQRRTYFLSNGQVIWDLSGNVWEWVDYINIDDKPSPSLIAWTPYTDILGSNSMPLSLLIPEVAINLGWNDATQGIGNYLSGDNGFGGALRRGGVWATNSDAGLFSALLSDAPDFSNNGHGGFRCSYSTPEN